PAVLEEAIHYAHHADVLRRTGNPRPQAADTPHQQVDGDPGSAGGIESADDGRIDERVHLRDDAGGLAATRPLRLALDEREDPLLQPEGRDGKSLPLRRLGVAGQEVEERRRIVREL